MKIIAFDKFVDTDFVDKYDVEISTTIEDLVAKVDFLSLK